MVNLSISSKRKGEFIELSDLFDLFIGNNGQKVQKSHDPFLNHSI